MGNMVRSFNTTVQTLEISLEQIVACTPKQTNTSTVSVKNNAQVILFRSKQPFCCSLKLLQLLQIPGKLIFTM